MSPSNHRLLLRELPLPTRLVLAFFLASVGVGYFAALIQLHFQHASPGRLLPTEQDTLAAYHGRTGLSHMERLLLADEGRPFNGTGTMRHAFTSKSAGWRSAIKRRAKDKNLTLSQAEDQLRAERNGERLALLAWIHSGADRSAFEENAHPLTASLANRPITAEFVDRGMDGAVRVKIASILETRCTRCHSEGAGGAAGQIPLETWEHVHEYCEPEATSGGMGLKKLAQSTHVHLLGFALLYGLTGVIVSMTSYPLWFRLVLAPLPLVAQIVDIGCWWLARLDPVYAKIIMFSGGAVAGGLALQIVLSVFNMFGKVGRTVLVLAILAAAAGGFVVFSTVIDPHLAREALNSAIPD